MSWWIKADILDNAGRSKEAINVMGDYTMDEQKPLLQKKQLCHQRLLPPT